jgi:CRISPR-associated exonuclease Cas4
MGLLLLAALLALSAILLLYRSGQQRQAIGLPKGRIIYVDTGAWGVVEKPLYDPVLRLTGKPDYLIEQENTLIPVEVKSTRVSDAPHDAHIFQLAAYCLLVEASFGKRPAYGVLHYPNRTFAIDYTPALEEALLSLLEDLRAQEQRRNPARSHHQPQRCARCGYRSICDQRL